MSSVSNSIREAYDRWANTYDSILNQTRDLDGALLRKDFSAGNMGDVLEVGCGTGKNTRWLAQRARVIGLDFSRLMLERCRIVAPTADLRLADVNERWPVEDHSVDMVVINLVLEHIEDLHHIASESARALKSQGGLRVSELHPQRQLEGKRARFEDRGEWVEPPIFVHSTKEYKDVFQGAGFVLEAMDEPHGPGDDDTHSPRLLVLSFSL